MSNVTLDVLSFCVLNIAYLCTTQTKIAISFEMLLDVVQCTPSLSAQLSVCLFLKHGVV